MKVIFLDFDGVLNPGRHMRELYRKWKLGEAKSRDEYGTLFDEDCVRWMEELAYVCGAKVVISSTWRIRYSKQELIDMFKVRGIEIEIFDTTPVFGRKRGEEIEAWLSEHDDVEAYAIIDDNSDMLSEQMLHFIKCDSDNGFRYEEFTKAYKILQQHETTK